MSTWFNFTGTSAKSGINYPSAIYNSAGYKLLWADDIEWGLFSMHGNTISSTDTLLDYINSLETKITNGFDTNNACLFKGTYTAASTSGTTLAGAFSVSPSSGALGWMFIVSNDGYFYDYVVEAGDLIIVGKDTPSAKTDYYVILKNIDPNVYVTKSTTLTITGVKTFTAATYFLGLVTFSVPASGDLLGNASTATRLYSTTAVGSANTPVYFSGGLPVAANTYAGGTLVNLNGSNKNSTTATIYAPTTYGSDGLILIAKGSGTAPVWLDADFSLYVDLTSEQTITGTKTFSGAVSIDDLTAGNLSVSGTLTSGNSSLGVATCTTINGYSLKNACSCSTSAVPSSGTTAATGDSLVTMSYLYYALPTINGSTFNRSNNYNIYNAVSADNAAYSLSSTSWTASSITIYGLATGSYMLSITDTTNSAVFTGVFGIVNSSSQPSTDIDEIPLHMYTSGSGKARIYAATLNGVIMLSSLDASSTSHSLTITYKRII